MIPRRKAKTNRGRNSTVHSKELGGPIPRREVESGGEGNRSKIGRNLDKDLPEDNGVKEGEKKASK